MFLALLLWYLQNRIPPTHPLHQHDKLIPALSQHLAETFFVNFSLHLMHVQAVISGRVCNFIPVGHVFVFCACSGQFVAQCVRTSSQLQGF